MERITEQDDCAMVDQAQACEVVIPGYVWKESEVPAVKVLLGNTKPFLAASVSDIPSVAKCYN